jgi:tRNA-Thr(GGU) m(6)t(6)A37 methyltransferase TsaA
MKPTKVSFQVKPIGLIRKGRILLNRRWIKSLQGIDGFSHLLLFVWFHKTHKTDLLIHPKTPKSFPKIGFLATRTPHRPNPIGFTVVKLVKRRGCELWVEGLDAWDGTPVLDLKPYTKREWIKGYRIPGWVKKLDRLEKDPLRKYGS